tara:strand:- start:751 stop:1263 length:513 start_codon:yes stop_codon:yes gene_type:complete
MAENMQGLTSKQKRFVEYYLGNGENATKAYKQAGYKAKNDNVASPEASKLLQNPKVSQAIMREKAGELAKQAKRARKADIDQDWLVTQYIDTIELAKQDKQYNVMKSSIDSIGKLLGLMVDRKELAVSGEVSHLASLDTQSLMNALTQAQQPEAIEAEFQVIDSDETGTI